MVNQNWHQTVAKLIAQYNAGPGSSVFEHTGELYTYISSSRNYKAGTVN